MAKDTIKWIIPERLMELDNAELIKIDSGAYTPTQFRSLFYENSSQWHKLFLKLQEEKKIFIIKKAY
jgi:hypothetical protein